MMIENEININNTAIEKVIANDSLLKLCFEFCDSEDILNLSSVSKRFNKITRKLDYKFEDEIEKNYFSDYNNYE
jgi:hypothetical protein